ncbi:MAG TPA: thioesterase family protein [Byssovorax sp.]
MIEPHLVSKTPIRVRFCETDLMGIVHHANYLLYFEEARVDWLHKRGVSYDVWQKGGVHLPVVETRMRYKKAARFDEELVIEAARAELTRVTVRFAYKVLRGDELLVEGETLLACVGADMKAKRFPPDIAESFARAER